MNDEKVKQIVEVLDTASETHHTVYKREEGVDPDWATWYSRWLLEHSAFPEMFNKVPVRSELIYILVKSDKEYSNEKLKGSWQEYYSDKMLEHFS